MDILIAFGDIPPVIVVSATFDTKNQSQSFSRSVEELSVFHNDLWENLMPYIKNFVPMSGDCWIMGTYGGRYYPVEIVDYLEDMLAEGGYGKDDFRIYQGIGTDDPIWEQTDSQIQEIFTHSTFTPGNLHYAIIKGGRHDMDACERYLYHALQDFFGGEE